ncbi:MAG: hypothetical protein A4S09_08410 [Proteobacteria bacterium SG_bin7]|nr:MAG: hypothetical protein A4S09_08410 [Proteobacteria bacterium SG_bin7]
MIEVSSLHRSFRDKFVLRNINLTLAPNDFIYLEGPNGAGKTTLFRILSSLMKPTSGDVIVNGKSIFQNKNCYSWRKQVAYLPADDNVFLPSLTGRQNIVTFCRFFGMTEKETLNRIKQLEEFFPLANSMETKYGSASSGMKQKIKIAFAFTRSAEVYLLDEPFRSLDTQTRSQFLNLIAVRSKGKAVMYTEHGDKNLLDLTTRTLCLEHGGIS